MIIRIATSARCALSRRYDSPVRPGRPVLCRAGRRRENAGPPRPAAMRIFHQLLGVGTVMAGDSRSSDSCSGVKCTSMTPSVEVAGISVNGRGAGGARLESGDIADSEEMRGDLCVPLRKEIPQPSAEEDSPWREVSHGKERARGSPRRAEHSAAALFRPFRGLTNVAGFHGSRRGLISCAPTEL